MYFYLYLGISVWITVFVFIFANFWLKNWIQIYSYLYAPKNVNLNIFAFANFYDLNIFALIFWPENYICHTLNGTPIEFNGSQWIQCVTNIFYLFLQIPGRIFIFVFVFVLFFVNLNIFVSIFSLFIQTKFTCICIHLFCQPEYICICICKKINKQILHF